jgi:hypothetical protein
VILLAGVFFLDDAEQFRVNIGERVIFCKHEKLQSIRVRARDKDRLRGSHDNGTGSLIVRFHWWLPRRTANEISRFPVDAHLSPTGQELTATFRQLRET